MHISFYGPVHGTSLSPSLLGLAGRGGALFFFFYFSLPRTWPVLCMLACKQRALACTTLACIIGERQRSGVEKFDSNLRTADALRSSGEFLNFDNLACTLWRVLRQLFLKSKHMDKYEWLLVDCGQLERVQRLVIRLVSDLRPVPFEEMHQLLNFFYLKCRRLLILIIKNCKGENTPMLSNFFRSSRYGVTGRIDRILQGSSLFLQISWMCCNMLERITWFLCFVTIRIDCFCQSWVITGVPFFTISPV